MQFLANNWIFFAVAFVFFLALLVWNFVKAGQNAMNFDREGFGNRITLHLVLAFLCFLSGIPSAIGIILAIIKFAQAN